MRADDPNEVINLLRSPFVNKSLSQLHPGEKAGVVPLDKARGLQTALVGWPKATGSEYETAVKKREMNTSHINQVPMLAAPMPDATWRAGQSNTLSVPAGTFLDVDGDTLVYAGTLDRAPLPHWLSVDAKDGSTRGIPPSKGNHLLRLTATDQKSGSAFAELTLACS
mgnify:CR=1 FL=1